MDRDNGGPPRAPASFADSCSRLKRRSGLPPSFTMPTLNATATAHDAPIATTAAHPALQVAPSPGMQSGLLTPQLRAYNGQAQPTSTPSRSASVKSANASSDSLASDGTSDDKKKKRRTPALLKLKSFIGHGLKEKSEPFLGSPIPPATPNKAAKLLGVPVSDSQDSHTRLGSFEKHGFLSSPSMSDPEDQHVSSMEQLEQVRRKLHSVRSDVMLTMRKGLEQQLTLISPTRANTSSSLSMPVGHYKQMGVCRLLSPRREMPGGDDPFFDEGSYTKITPINNHVQALSTDVAHPVDILQSAPARKRKPRTRKGKGAKSLQKLPPIKETSFTDDGVNSIGESASAELSIVNDYVLSRGWARSPLSWYNADSISSYELADDEVSSDSDLDISDDETYTIGVTRPATGQIPVRGSLQHLEDNLLDDLESGNFEKDDLEVHDYHDENEELRHQIQASYEYMDLLREQIDTMREIDRTDKFGKIAIGIEEETVKLKQIRKEALDMMSIDFKNTNCLGSMSLETALLKIDDLRTRVNNDIGRIHLIKEVEEKQLGHKKMKKELDNMDSEYQKMKKKYEDMMYREKTPARSLPRRSVWADIRKTYPFQEEDYETTKNGWYESSSDDQIGDNSTPTMRYASLAMVCSGKAKLVGAPTKDKKETTSKDKSSDDSFHSVDSTNCNGSYIQPTALQQYTSVASARTNGGAESSSSDSKEIFNRPRYVDAFNSTDSVASKFHGSIGYPSALSGNGFYSTYYGGSGYAPSLTGGYTTRYPQPVSSYYQSVSGFNPNFNLGSQSTSTVSSGSIHQLKHKKGCVEKQALQFSTKNWVDGYNSTEQRPVSERLDPDVVADQETPPAVFPKEPPPVPKKSASRR